MVIEAVPVAGVTDQPPNAQDNVSLETICAKLQSIDEMLDQHLAMQKESQKQAATLVIDEKWLEEKIALAVHQAFEANSEALLARFQEENEKVMKECVNKIKEMTTGLLNKVQSMAEKTAKEVTHTITTTLEQILDSSLMEAFQAGVGDKMENQLEKSVNAKLKATVARQIQAQFQTSGKQSLEASAPSSSSPSPFEPSDSINEQDFQSDNLSLETKELLFNLLTGLKQK